MSTINYLLAIGQVDVVDSDHVVYMVHFNDQYYESTGRTDNNVSLYRGDVYSKLDNSCVCPSMGLTEEISWGPVKAHGLPAPIYDSPPGTVLRAYQADGVWYLSTHRRLHASQSRWGGVKSFQQLFMDMVDVDRYNDGDFQTWAKSTLTDGKLYTFLLVHEEWVPNDQHGVYLINIPNMTQNQSDELSHNCFRVLPEVSSSMAHQQEPQWSYLVFDGWHWLRFTSKRYVDMMELQGHCPDTRERYLELVSANDTEKLGQYLLSRPSVADMKFEDDHAWRTVLRRLLEDAEFRHQVIVNRCALQRWNKLAVQWQERGMHSVKHGVKLKARALTWWHREKDVSHFATDMVDTL